MSDNLAAPVFTHPNLSIFSSFPIPKRSSEYYSERFLFERERIIGHYRINTLVAWFFSSVNHLFNNLYWVNELNYSELNYSNYYSKLTPNEFNYSERPELGLWVTDDQFFKGKNGTQQLAYPFLSRVIGIKLGEKGSVYNIS